MNEGLNVIVNTGREVSSITLIKQTYIYLVILKYKKSSLKLSYNLRELFNLCLTEITYGMVFYDLMNLFSILYHRLRCC